MVDDTFSGTSGERDRMMRPVIHFAGQEEHVTIMTGLVVHLNGHVTHVMGYTIYYIMQ